ncbi:MAG: hypothetical protein WCT28_03040 [Patescibacteria group bacterium]|jgi:tetratricopeptide (TPR) repeat protein
MKITRKQTVLSISIVVICVLVGYGVWLVSPRWFNPYYGMKTTIEVQMDDATRTLVQQRLAMAKSSIVASEKAGEKVDMNSYLVIAEHEHMLGDLVASRKAYETYLDLNPVSYVAWNAYASLLETMGDIENAGVAYQRAISELKTEEEYYRDYAEYLAENYPEHEDWYKQVLDDAFENIGQTPWTMVALGDWFFEHHDCELGHDHYSVAKTLAPESESIAVDAKEKYAACTAK